MSRELKDSGVEWIGKIPANWSIEKIKYTTYVKGRIGWQGLKSDEFTDEGPYLVTGKDFIGKNVNWESCHHISSERYHEAPPIQLKENDLLITKDGTIGKTAIVRDMPDKAILNSGIFVTRSAKYEVDFMYWMLNSQVFDKYIKFFETGSTIKHLYQETFENFSYPLPTRIEQKRINLFLNRKIKLVDEVIKNKGNMMTLLEKQRQSIITEAVTKGLNPNVKMKDSGVEWIGEIPEHWKVKKIKHFATHVGSGKTPSGGSEVYLDEGVPFLRSLNVHFDGIRLKDLAFISEDTNAEMKSSQVQPLDILLNITGASIGRTAIVPKDFGRANVNQHVCIIRLNQKKMYPYYFNMLMASDVINQQIWFAQNGSSREGLNFVQVKELKFAMPPTIEEQREINDWVFNKLKTIYDVMSKIKEQIEKLKEYRQSLIYEAVTGKIDVRDMELDDVR
ncbi:restriction endonuclease subunit S [Bacillus stratosphericus]|nr:restriction endonuclease subunit S [Bacillus stratosphericus]